MSTDMNIIRKSLHNCTEIIIPSPIAKGSIIKYITLKGDNERFYQGGRYKQLGNNKIIIEKSGKSWSVPIHLYHKDGSIKYTSRFFIENKNDTCEETTKPLELIIQSQQDVITKMSEKLKELELEKYYISNDKENYEKILQRHKYDLKDKDMMINNLTDKCKQYESVIRKLHYLINQQ